MDVEKFLKELGPRAMPPVALPDRQAFQLQRRNGKRQLLWEGDQIVDTSGSPKTESEFVFLRPTPSNAHRVGGTASRKDETGPRFDPAASEHKMTWQEALIGCRRPKAGVKCEQLVHERRPAPPMADDEQRIIAYLAPAYAAAPEQLLRYSQERIRRGESAVEAEGRETAPRYAKSMPRYDPRQCRSACPHPEGGLQPPELLGVRRRPPVGGPIERVDGRVHQRFEVIAAMRSFESELGLW